MVMRPGSQAYVSYVVAETGSLPILYDAWKGLVSPKKQAAYIVSVKCKALVCCAYQFIRKINFIVILFLSHDF